MKGRNAVKIGSAVLAIALLGYFGFTWQLEERHSALILRFGAPRAVVTEAGLHSRLPWPFEEIVTFDQRQRYLDSGYLETLTKDKKNIIIQTWMAWHVADPLQFHVAVGTDEAAQNYLADLATDAKNSVMGNWPLSALISLKTDDLHLREIETALKEQVARAAKQHYGIIVDELMIKRLGFPSSNVEAVLNQMTADRNKLVVQLGAEGQRDAALIRGKADVEAARIRAEGKEKAAQILAESEKDVASIYSKAHKEDPELYQFLTKLRVLESAVDDTTVLVTNDDEPPFDVLKRIPR